MRIEGDAAVVRVEEGLTVPPGGIVIVSPFDGKETVVRKLPAQLRIAR
jgi:hypothetical protein